MSTTARKSAATRELLRQVAQKATGVLTLHHEGVQYQVYLMSGAIIGAVRPDDDLLLLRRVELAGVLAPDRLEALSKVASAGQSVFGILLDEVDGAVMEAILFDRFRDNLIAYVGSPEAPSFEALHGVFVDNMQMGQNAARLIDGACNDADLAMRYGPDLEVAAGAGETRSEEEALLFIQASAQATPLETLVAHSSLEPWNGRAIAAVLLDRGVLVDTTVELASLDMAPLVPDPEEELLADAATHDGTPLPSFDDEDEDLETDDAPEPVMVESDPPDRTPPEPFAVENVPAPDLVEIDDLRELPDADIEPLDDFEDLPDADIEPLDDPLELPDTDLEPLEELLDDPPDEAAEVLNTSRHMSDEDLAFFADHEDDRGAGEGGFTTELHNLDKVDVTDAGDVYEDPHTARFSAPVLSERDALDKVEVCNDVLRRITSAFDAAAGPGRGRAQIQLLVDGAPSKYATLLHDLQITDRGELPAMGLLANLADRPSSEHRQLINSALKNFIERALSSAADDLPEDSFDDVYESVAGYNQRLGL